MPQSRRSFNTAGPCNPARHYMLPPLPRLPRLRRLVEEGEYFVVHAPRQSGKTTLLLSLVEQLSATEDYAVVLASCETGATAGDDIERGVDAVVHAIGYGARSLPDGLRPPEASVVAEVPAEHRLTDFLTVWCESSARPVVLLLDEIDALRDGTLLSVLRQLRTGYAGRPRSFPHALVLVGLRDVRDYRMGSGDESGRLGTSSPFNVKVESLVLPDFDQDAVTELVAQHQHETGQAFTDGGRRLYELTRGQPWLVNALARDAVEYEAGDITEVVVDRVAEALIVRRDTHIDSLVDRLRDERVRRVLEPILVGRYIDPDVLEDDVQFTKDLGLVRAGEQGLEIANPIYREVVPRALSHVLQESLPVPPAAFVRPDGALDFEALIDGFRGFWRENAEFFLQRSPYSEAAAQLIFMAWLQRVVNGGGFVDREYAVGSGRIDICVRWPRSDGSTDRFAAELKVWRDRQSDPAVTGIEQISAYLRRLGVSTGTLMIFDVRSRERQEAERSRVSRGDLQIEVIRL